MKANNSSLLRCVSLVAGAALTLSGAEDHLGIYKLTKAEVGSLDNKNATTGGPTSFRGPLGYVSIELAS